MESIGPDAAASIERNIDRPGESDREAVRYMREVVREGHALGLFAEGTRQRSGVPGPVQAGAAMAAIQEGVPVVPAAIHGSQTWRPGNFHPVSVAWGEPFRWCQHHTVLVARRFSKRQPEVSRDPLVRNAQTDNAYYASFIRAVRTLPMQQREAFILTHGEEWDTRNLATAMDCSTEAAAVHLKEATRTLSA